MSTRCYIGYTEDNDAVTFVYCHHNGYPKGVGELLTNFYHTLEKAKELVSLGDISVLDEDLENTLFYIRDCNDESQGSKPKVTTMKDYKADWEIEYVYLFKKDKWYCKSERRDIDLYKGE